MDWILALALLAGVLVVAVSILNGSNEHAEGCPRCGATEAVQETRALEPWTLASGEAASVRCPNCGRVDMTRTIAGYFDDM